MRAVTRTVEHVGEWQVALAADTVEELFVQVARVIAGSARASRGAPADWETVSVAARDVATLLADWANELLGRSEVAGRAYDDVRALRLSVERDGSAQVSAEVRGCPLREWTSPLKAATYHALSVEQRGRRWHATLLFDV